MFWVGSQPHRSYRCTPQLSPDQPPYRTRDRLRRVRFQEFEAVSPGIFGEKAARSRKRIIVGDLYAVAAESFSQLAKIRDGERWVCLLRGLERGFDADVKLLVAVLKPTTAPGAKRSGLFDFAQAENRAVEFASGGLAAPWRC